MSGDKKFIDYEGSKKIIQESDKRRTEEFKYLGKKFEAVVFTLTGDEIGDIENENFQEFIKYIESGYFLVFEHLDSAEGLNYFVLSKNPNWRTGEDVHQQMGCKWRPENE